MGDLIEQLRHVEATAEPPAPDAISDAVADAALRQFELFGVARSTMAEISRRAGVARVTVYRRFPAKDALVEAVILRELRRFLAELDGVVGPLEDPEDKLVDGFVFTLNAIRGHALLQRLLESEPEMLLPYLTVQGAPFIAVAREALAARLTGELDSGRTPEELEVVADVVVRLLLSYLLTPQTPVDLDDPAQARAFALRYLRPIVFGRQESEAQPPAGSDGAVSLG